jgi:hypothetical protein
MGPAIPAHSLTQDPICILYRAYHPQSDRFLLLNPYNMLPRHTIPIRTLHLNPITAVCL